MNKCDKEELDLTPSSRSSSIRVFNQIPLSSTMLHKSLPLRITAETTDSGLASTNYTQTISGSESSFRILDERQSEDVNRHHHSGETSASKNNQTPRSGFMLLRRNLSSRGSSTPKRCVSHCPFPTPDRLNEPFISHEVFENQLLALQEKNSFSPCIDWQSTMNPTVFDTSNPAAYLPPVRSQSAEQRYEKAINAFFQRKVVPSPTPSTARRRSAICSMEMHNSTIELESPVPVPPTEISTATQTQVTIPPNCDIEQILAPFTTFTGNDTHVSVMEMSRSSSSSSTSASSLSRRKLFSEDDADDHNEEASSASVVIHKYHSFDETVALSSPPKNGRMDSSSKSNMNVLGNEAFEGDSFTSDAYRVAEIEEIPKGILDIDLSPIRSQFSADRLMETKRVSAASIVVDSQDDQTADDAISTINMSIV